LATHADMNPTHPLFSWIRLAPDGRGSENDGRLEVHEILRVPVRSRLVFLSGCETALGAGGVSSFAAGDDYATLARAFLYAGAGGVIATLWRVEDQGAAALAERFYQELRTAEAAEALARAQRALLLNPEYRAPYYWGGYVLSGEMEGAAQSW
jgi:CHAT domain-containing protein